MRSGILLWMLLLGTVAWAQDPDDQPDEQEPNKKEPVKEVVVTATGREADPFEVPYSVGVMNRGKFLGERHARSVPDALAELPLLICHLPPYASGPIAALPNWR